MDLQVVNGKEDASVSGSVGSSTLVRRRSSCLIDALSCTVCEILRLVILCLLLLSPLYFSLLLLGPAVRENGPQVGLFGDHTLRCPPRLQAPQILARQHQEHVWPPGHHGGLEQGP